MHRAAMLRAALLAMLLLAGMRAAAASRACRGCARQLLATDSTPAPLTQKEALLKLKAVLDKEGSLGSWQAAQPLSTYEGVAADSAGAVTSITLAFIPLGGSLSAVPAAVWAALPALYSLNLGWANLTGRVPSELASAERLSFLTLNNNELSGSVPAQLATLKNLRSLMLGGNDLEGGIPRTFLALVSSPDLHQQLQLLDLTENPRMAGCIPPPLLAAVQPFFVGLGDPSVTTSIEGTAIKALCA